MNVLDKDTIRKYLIELSHQAEASEMENGGYICLIMRKLYRLFHLTHTKLNKQESIEEWLELMAFCETMMYMDLFSTADDNNDKIYYKLKKQCEDIRNGKFLQD